MIIREVRAKSVLSKSKIFDYVVNPYTGCQNACTYCYARFMKRFTGHTEPWGEFVDVKANAAELLSRQVLKMHPGRVWISGVCDPYQPLEKKYGLTRQCLEILTHHNIPVTIQTKSPLAVRDIDLLKNAPQIEVGFSVATADEKIRRLFEPGAPPIQERITSLETIHKAGIRTFAMIAPLLPGAENLASMLRGKVDSLLIDRMNYHYGDWVYRKYRLDNYLSDAYFYRTSRMLADSFRQACTECRVI